jgi:hypothetical protein
VIEINKSKLDLRFEGKLDSETSLLFNTISNEKRSGFNNFIAELSEPNIDNVDWWLEGPASRNTLSSPLFHRYCCLFLVLNLIENNKFNYKAIIIDSEEFKQTLSQVLNDNRIFNINFILDKKSSYFKRSFIKKIFLIPALYCKIFLRFIIAKSTRRKPILIETTSPIVLIDTFMMPAYTDSDRWYGSLWKSMTQYQRNSVWFVPTIILTNISEFFGVYKRLRKNERNFLIKEDYLNFSDILFAFGVRKRLRRVKITTLKVAGYDFSAIVKSELLNNRDVLTVVEALLLYRFIERLSKTSVKIRLSIDWFEGQSMDKAWSLGFYNFFPESKRIGFRAFESYPFYLCSYPIQIEKRAGVIPQVFAVQGKATIATVQEFLPNADVIVVPSFRSDHVWGTSINYSDFSGNHEVFHVLVTLPIKMITAIQILTELLNIIPCLSIYNKKKIDFIIKVHPASTVNKEFDKLVINFPSNFLLTKEKSFPKLIEKTDLLISEASSTCLEALARGIPVVVIQNKEGLTYNPIPSIIPSHLYMNTLSSKELKFAIEKYLNLTPKEKENQRESSIWVRDNYFEPITIQGINKLLMVKE